MSHCVNEALLADAIRVLSMDAVQQANSGHPGMPMGMADIAVALWKHHLRHNPSNPQWPNRDRFVLSNGHGSMLLYSVLHLTGYALSAADLAQFRQWKSKTPGHPEYGETPGVETSTGPLGQGLANAVGMALAERLLAAEFNRPDFPIVDHYTYAFVGDGCLMEGISHEVCSLAGTWGLGKLIVIYDDNGISIDGPVSGWFTENTPQRFLAYGWHVIPAVDGHDIAAVSAAIATARAHRSQPTLICCKTAIGRGAPTKAGHHDTHGAPLGVEEIAASRVAMTWTHAPFEIPQAIYDAWDARAAGAVAEGEWQQIWDGYRVQHPALADAWTRRLQRALPMDFEAYAAKQFEEIQRTAPTIASRKASQNALQQFAPILPELIGGSADLAASNLTQWREARALTAQTAGNYIHYGVREFGMAAITNGLVLHGGFQAFAGTFLIFSEYARNALRMAALMRITPIFVLTHDSIGLGEDGPTHQPIEQIATLRLMPNMDVWRPCDAAETLVAWQAALESVDHPTSLVLSRQNLPFHCHAPVTAAQIRRGGYILKDVGEGKLHVVLIATGSEVDLAMRAAAVLAQQHIGARVVSMPSSFQFDRQALDYRAQVLPDGIPRVAIEAGVTDYWYKYVGLAGAVVGIDHYGASAPAATLLDAFGFTVDRVIAKVRAVLS